MILFFPPTTSTVGSTRSYLSNSFNHLLSVSGYAPTVFLSSLNDIGAQSQSEGVVVVDDSEEEQDDEGVSKVWYVVGVLVVMIVGGGAYWMYMV